ncbi:hypothetical protein EV177_005960 [Coemansia sp. RSA 1804]|nr:hypothetical protein EV177_005960 [Coemansia sp. RSA 1804]
MMGLISELNNESHNQNPTTIDTVDDYSHCLERNMFQPLSAIADSSVVGESIGNLVTVLGVVVGFEPPTKSRGPDYVMRLRIADPTTITTITRNTEGPVDSIELNVFRPSVDQMPRVERTGDIVYFDSVKIMDYRSRIQLFSNIKTQWDVLRYDDHASRGQPLHPLVAYLSEWWLEKKKKEEGAGEKSLYVHEPPIGSGGNGVAMDPGVTKSGSSRLQPLLPPNGYGGKTNSTSTNSKYLSTMSGLKGQAYADMYLEVIKVIRPGYGDSNTGDPADGLEALFPNGIDMDFPGNTDRVQYLVTDYTENPLIIDADDSIGTVSSSKFAKLTVFDSRIIHRFPTIEPGTFYWFRNVKAEYSETHGLSLKLSSNAMFPKTILCRPIAPDDPSIQPLADRKAQYARDRDRDRDRDQEKENAVPLETSASIMDPDLFMASADLDNTGALSVAAESSQADDGLSMYEERPLRLGGEPVYARVTPIAEILDSEKIDYCVYRVVAPIVRVHPDNPEDTLVFVCDMCGHTQEHVSADNSGGSLDLEAARCGECNEAGVLEFRLLLKLADREGGRECVVVCQGIGDGEWTAESEWLLGNAAERKAFIQGIAPIWRAVHPAHGGSPGGMVAETLVASVVVPGPGRSVARCLMAAGGMNSISFST